MTQRHTRTYGFLLFYVILCEQLCLLISCLLALLTDIEPLMALIRFKTEPCFRPQNPRYFH